MRDTALHRYGYANGVLGLAIGLISALRFVPSLLSDGLQIPGWVPLDPSAGQAVVYVLLFRRGVEFIVDPFIVVLVGYWIGRRIEVSDRYREILWTCAGGTLAGASLGFGLTTLWLATAAGGVTAVEAAAFLITGVVGATVTFVFSGFAGAAFGEFHARATD